MKKTIILIILCITVLSVTGFKDKSNFDGGKTLDINQIQNHGGVTVNLNRVVLSQDSLKVYVTISNGTKHTVFFDRANAVIVKDDRQYNPLPSSGSYLLEPQAVILPGTISEGIMSYPLIKLPLRLIISCHTSDYSTIVLPFSFDITT